MFPAVFEAEVIAFDLHGVIDHNPRFFKPLLKLLQDAGRTVVIVSGPQEEQVQNELAALRIVRTHHFDEIYSIVDSLNLIKWRCGKTTKGLGGPMTKIGGCQRVKSVEISERM